MFHFETPALRADLPMIFLFSLRTAAHRGAEPPQALLRPDAIPATTHPGGRARKLAMASARRLDRAQLAPPAFHREYRLNPPPKAPKWGCWLPRLPPLEYRP